MIGPDTIIGVIGNIISCLLFLSPILTFKKIRKKGAVEGYSHNPYILTLLNCAFWVYFGVVQPDKLLVITINGFGLAIELIYVAFYSFYANKQQRQYIGKKLLGVLILCALIMLPLTFISNPKIWRGEKIVDATTWKGVTIGVACVLANIAMYISPCDKLNQVRKTKSVEYMPLPLSVFSFLNGGVWLSFGVLKQDWYIIASNSTGCLFGIVQLSFYAWYYFKYPQSKNNKIMDEKAGGGNKIGGEKAYGGKVELSDMVEVCIDS